MQIVSIAVTAVVAAAMVVLAIIMLIQYRKMNRLADDIIEVKKNIEADTMGGMQ